MSFEHRISSTDAVQAQRETELAQLALRGYGLRDARIYFLRQGFTHVVRVVSPTRGEFVLRMYVALQPALEGPLRANPRLSTSALPRSPETLRSQLLWLSALARDTDLLVPEPVPTLNGSLVTHVSFEDRSWRRALLRRVRRNAHDPYHQGRHCVLLRWVPGRVKGQDLSVEDISLVGSYLAKLHRYAERCPVPEGSVFPRWDWDWLFGGSAHLWSKGEEFYSASEMEVFEATAQRVRRDLSELGYGSDAFGLIHRDPNLNNLVFNGGAVGTIDFDLCGLGHYLLDLTVTLAALKTHHRGDYMPRWNALVESYQRERALPPNHRKYFETFVAMRMVAAVNRQLALLGSEATARRSWVRSRGPRFLSNAVRRLEKLTKNDGAL